MKSNYKIYHRGIAFAIGWIVFVTASIILTAIASFAQQLPTNYTTIRPDAAAEIAYQKLPEFPTENQYVNKETGEVANQNTLIGRLIRYHQYIKDRPLYYRLDWKLTLADYLGANETIPEARYPGSTTLSENPFKGDRAVIESLSRERRNQLVDTLVSIYNPQAEDSTTNTPVRPQPNLENHIKPKIPQRGNADLLLP